MKKIKSYGRFISESKDMTIEPNNTGHMMPPKSLYKDGKPKVVKLRHTDIIDNDVINTILSYTDLYTKEELLQKSDEQLIVIYNELGLEEGFKDFLKKAIGQQTEWKLDGSYINKASSDAKGYLRKHPAAKVLLQSLLKSGLDQQQAEEATLHCYDADIRSLNGYKIEFNKETKVLILNAPKGSMNPSLGSI